MNQKTVQTVFFLILIRANFSASVTNPNPKICDYKHKPEHAQERGQTIHRINAQNTATQHKP